MVYYHYITIFTPVKYFSTNSAHKKIPSTPQNGAAGDFIGYFPNI